MKRQSNIQTNVAVSLHNTTSTSGSHTLIIVNTWFIELTNITVLLLACSTVLNSLLLRTQTSLTRLTKRKSGFFFILFEKHITIKRGHLWFNLARQMENIPSTTDLSHISIEWRTHRKCSERQGKAKLGAWLDEPSVCSIQKAQSDLLLPAEPGRHSLTGTRANVGRSSLLCG